MAGLSILAVEARPPLLAGEPLLWLHQLPGARDHARAHALLCSTLAYYLACVPEAVSLHCAEGRAPQVDARWQDLPLSLSLSYADEFCLLALCAGAHIGVDLLKIQSIPDWQAVSTLYLGPHVCAELAVIPAAQRDSAFARHWAELEARGKCLGLGLQEFSLAHSARLHAPGIQLHALSGMPAGLLGALAMQMKLKMA